MSIFLQDWESLFSELQSFSQKYTARQKSLAEKKWVDKNLARLEKVYNDVHKLIRALLKFDEMVTLPIAEFIRYTLIPNTPVYFFSKSKDDTVWLFHRLFV